MEIVNHSFTHPNIAQTYDLDIDNGQLFLTMEFVPGATLLEMAKATRSARLRRRVGIGSFRFGREALIFDAIDDVGKQRAGALLHGRFIDPELTRDRGRAACLVQ